MAKSPEGRSTPARDSGDQAAVQPEHRDEYSEVLASLGDLVLEMQAACPYTQDRKLSGLPSDVRVGPDAGDLFAPQLSTTVSGIQTKAQGMPATRETLVPYGLPPDVHVLLGEAVESPLDIPGVLADDLDFACHNMIALGAGFASWQRNQWRKLCAFAARAGFTAHLADG